MRQVFLSKSGQILVEDAPAPEAGPGEVLIDVAWSLISTGTETAAVAAPRPDLPTRVRNAAKLARMGIDRLRERGFEETLRKARVREGISASMGYSVSGTVREVGADASDLEVGQRVAAAGSRYAHHAEVVAVPRNLVVPVPAAVSLRAASFATVGAIALQGVRRAAPQVGETVLVIGLGLIGQITVQILVASGCRVIGVDPRAERVSLAQQLPGGLVAASGSDPAEVERVVRAETSGIGADCVLLCAGTASSDPANTALRCVRQRGRVVVVGAVGMDLERNPFYQKEVDFTISCSYGPGRYDPTYEEGGIDYPIGFVRWTENRNLAAFLDLVERRRVDPDLLIASEHALDDAAQAFGIAKAQGGSGVAVVLRYPERPTKSARTIELRRVAAPTGGETGIAVIGAGGFAASTLIPPLLASPSVRLRAVVTRTSGSAAKIAQEFRAERASTDPEEILRDPAVDAVVIATRHDLHAPLAMRALAAGKHVFLEKPMGISHSEVDALRDAALASGLVFSVGYNRRYAPLSLRVREAIAAARGPSVVIYRVLAGEISPGHWTLDPRVGGGRIVGEACHMIDLLAAWLGPELLSWHAEGLPSRDAASPSPQSVVIGLRFRGASGHDHVASLIYTSLGARGLPKERIEVQVGGGSITLTDFEKLEVQGLPAKSVTLPRPDKGHGDEMRFFVEAIQGKQTPLLSVHEAHFATDLALRIDEAVRGRR